jgi:hypothetical protein
MDIKQELIHFSMQKKLLFAISCTSRIMHFFWDYKKANDNSFIYQFTKGIEDILYENCGSQKIGNIKKLITSKDVDKIESLIPDSDEDGSCEAVLAQNAIIALAYCVQFIIDEDVSCVYCCSQKVLESIDIIALGILNVEDETTFIIKELEIQREFIKTIDSFSVDLIDIEIEKIHSMVELYKVNIE